MKHDDFSAFNGCLTEEPLVLKVYFSQIRIAYTSAWNTDAYIPGDIYLCSMA